MKVYLVHRGFMHDENSGHATPTGVVTYRLEKSEAEDVASLLNERLHELRYYEYLASQSNKALSGGRSGIQAADTVDVRKKFDDMRDAAHKSHPEQRRAADFWVSDMSVSKEDEAALTESLKAEAKK